MSNLLTIYSPQGERHEVSKPNFIDLSRHYGWTAHPPVLETKATNDASTNEAAAGSGSAGVATAELSNAGDTGAGSTDGRSDEGGSEGEGESGGPDGVLTGADEKAALIAELKDRFDYDADKRLSVSKLKAKLADLEANAE